MLKKRVPRLRIIVAPAAAEAMFRLAQRSLPNETGGVLVGVRSGTTILITATVGPGPNAKHGPASFTRDGEYSQRQIDRHFQRSGGRVDYIAEWHSHPLPWAPSGRDTASMRAIALDPDYRTPEPLLVLCILTGPGEWKLQGYTFNSRRLQATAIEIGSADALKVN